MFCEFGHRLNILQTSLIVKKFLSEFAQCETSEMNHSKFTGICTIIYLQKKEKKMNIFIFADKLKRNSLLYLHKLIRLLVKYWLQQLLLHYMSGDYLKVDWFFFYKFCKPVAQEVHSKSAVPKLAPRGQVSYIF